MIADEFTQMVWKNTQRIGLGMYRRNDTLVVEALYKHVGNIKGQFTSNVLDPKRIDQGGSSGNKDD